MLRFECVQDIDKAKELWELFSPKETIYDSWEFRFTFYKYYQPKILFYVGYLKDQPVGVLPLQQEVDTNKIDFFGGDYMEDNRVLIQKDCEQYIPEFYKQIDRGTLLEFIRGEDDFTKALPIEDYKYVLPLETFKSSDDFIQQNFHGETKKKLIKRLKKVEENNIKIIINQFENIDLMFKFNIETFQDRSVPSMFSRKYRQEIFRDFLSSNEFKPRILTFLVGGKIHAVSMALLYNNNYASINTGIIKEPLHDLNSYIHVKKIDDALSVGSKIFDAFVRDYGWKERWHFRKIPQHRFLEK